LEHVAKKNKPIILSTGLSTWEEVDEAISIITKYNDQLMVLHCVSEYPTPDDKMNLEIMKEMMSRYHPHPIGYSGHEKDILPTLTAVSLGAKVVERHFTLDRNLPGPDHSTVSITIEDFKEMVDKTRRIEQFFGSSNNRLTEAEMKTRKKHTKSLVTMCNITAGTIISEDMLGCKSPGYGLKPNMISTIIGKTFKENLLKDTVIIQEHINWNE
jgi:N,N'-diacetyllegionaminate synthase